MKTEQLTNGPSCLPCELSMPEGATGVVMVLRAAGGQPAQDRAMAAALSERGVGTLAVDLLSEPERERRANVYNVALLTHRVFQAMDWLQRRPGPRRLRLGLFGTGTAASAALVCAAERPQSVQAIVARSGRPELVLESLDRVRAPALLIVGDVDRDVLQLNYDAYRQLRCEKHLEIVAGAGCGFDEPHAQDAATACLADWFATHLQAPVAASAGGAAARSASPVAWAQV